jgi:hypothetical protein
MTRRSFLLHIDSLDVLDELSNEEAGKLLKAMRDYHNDEEMQLDALTKIVFSSFKNQFNRDTLKYQTTCERRANAGSMGGKQKVANASKPKQKVTKLADNDNVSKNDNVNDSDNKSDSDSDSKKIKDLSPKVDLNGLFEKVWKQYPSKQNKKKALATFISYVNKNKLNAEVFADGLVIDICKRCNSQQFGFDKLHFTTYMNGERWNDEITQNLSDADAKHEAWKRSIQETDYTDLLGDNNEI